MKKISIIIHSAMLVAALLLAPHAGAQIIDVQFTGTSSPPSPVGYTGTGADPLDTGTNWNMLSFGSTLTDNSVTDQNGKGTYSVSIADNGAVNLPAQASQFDQTSATANLFNYYAVASVGNVGTFTISGLPDDSPFTLYLYSQAGSYTGARPAVFTLTDDGKAFGTVIAGNGDTGTFDPGGNYMVLTGITGTNGSITGTFAAGAGNADNEADFNGFQVDFTAVPEPSTYALIGFGMLAFVFVVRRKAV